ncbi:type IV secretory system conjugative DNA transfer family protein [Nocardia sp. NPDC058640]|uniref:type IV secretory system conjugative DNA transfer family protein n=1 Tax=Nocardia sp. NPDC058640 TaxID=3346571 RepID=UPI003649DD9F
MIISLATSDPADSPVGRLLIDPAQLGSVVSDLATGIGASRPATLIAGAVVAVVLAIVRVIGRARRRRMAAGARLVRVLSPPVVDAKGALALWAHLIGLLRPAWKRTVFGQPHLGFEYAITPETGVSIQIWVPSSVPPGLIERAVASAWPGARTDTTPARPPLPEPETSTRRILAGGELRLGRRETLPIRTEPLGGDPVRDLILAADGLETGQAACVQILARQATGRRVRRTENHSGGHGLVLGAVTDLLDVFTPRRLGRSTRTGPRRDTGRPRDRQTSLEYTAATRASANKARGGHWDTVIRYAATITLPADPDPDQARQARAIARGRAHGLATVFGAVTDLNYYKRRRRLRLSKALAERRFRRGDLLSIPELATIAHLPYDPDLPGIDRAGARALAPTVTVPTSGEHTKPLGLADSGNRRPVALHVADARHHLHVLGATGTGKSTLLAQLILDDAEAGRGVVVIDPKGDLVADVLDRLPAHCTDKVVLFDADARTPPPCVNPLDTDLARIDLAVDNLVTIFRRIYARHWGPRTDDVLRASLLTLCTQPGVSTLADLARLLTEAPYRARITTGVTDPVLRGFWDSFEALSDAGRGEVIAPLLNKLRPLLLRPFVKAAVAAGRSTVDLAEVLDHGGICLVRIPKGSLGEETTRLMGSLLVARTWQTIAARASTAATQRADASLVLDEAHNFLNLSTPVEDMLAEARGLRLSLVLAHQNLGQLPRELRDGISANARSKIIFTASPEDAHDLARHTSPWLSEHDLTHLDVFHAAARVLVSGQQAPPFTFTTEALPPPTPGRARTIRAAALRSTAVPTPVDDIEAEPKPVLDIAPRPPGHDPRR